MIYIIDAARFKVDRLFVKEVVQRYLRAKNILESIDINIIFVGKRKMLYVATVYKREPEALPVLSFPYLTEKKMLKRTNENSHESELTQKDIAQQSSTTENQLLGEVFLCYPQVVLLAAERNKKVDETLQSLLEHGIHNLLKS